MNTLWSMIARLAPGRLFVFRPMASRFRFKKIVKCPESDQPAEVLVDASPGSPSKPKKKSSRLETAACGPKRKAAPRVALSNRCFSFLRRAARRSVGTGKVQKTAEIFNDLGANFIKGRL